MPKTAGRTKKGAGVALVPEPPMLFVEGAAYQEVTAHIEWRLPSDNAERIGDWSVDLNLITGPGTNGNFNLQIGMTGDADEHPINEIHTVRHLETLVGLYLALGLVIDKAREIGWHDIRVEAAIVGGIPAPLPVTAYESEG